MTKIHLCNSIGISFNYPEPPFYRLNTFLRLKGYNSSVYDLRIHIFARLKKAVEPYSKEIIDNCDISSRMSNRFLFEGINGIIEDYLCFSLDFIYKNFNNAGWGQIFTIDKFVNCKDLTPPYIKCHPALDAGSILLNDKEKLLKYEINNYPKTEEKDAYPNINIKILDAFITIILEETKKWLDMINLEKPDIIGFNISPRKLRETTKTQDQPLSIESAFASFLAFMAEKICKPQFFLYIYPPLGFEKTKEDLMSQNAKINLVIYNELEKTCFELITNIEEKKPISDIENTYYLNLISDSIKENPPRIFEFNEKENCFGDYQKAPLELYYATFKEHLYFSIDSARGCPLNCAFCNVRYNYGDYKARAPQDVANECLYYQNNLNIKNIYFNDRIFNGNMDDYVKFCDILINSNYKGKWICYLAITDKLTKDIIKKSYLAGLRKACYGVESGSDRVIRLMNKDYPVSLASEILKNTHSQGIQTEIAIMTDFPGETEEDFEKTLEFVRENFKYITSFRLNQFELYFGCDVALNPGKYNVDIKAYSEKFEESQRMKRLKEYILNLEAQND